MSRKASDPRFCKDKRPSNTGFGELLVKLNGRSIPADALDGVYDEAKASLAEVKALTEYEDGEASRLLTIVAFLGTVVGAVFTRFATDYPWPGFRALDTDRLSALTMAACVAFFAYILRPRRPSPSRPYTPERSTWCPRKSLLLRAAASWKSSLLVMANARRSEPAGLRPQRGDGNAMFSIPITVVRQRRHLSRHS